MKNSIRIPLAALALTLASHASAEPEGEITYVVQAGDTLYDLSREYLIDSASMRDIRSANGIRRPRLLQIGQEISMPRRLLRYEPVNLVIQSFSGKVTIDRDGRRAEAEPGFQLREGSIIATGPDSFSSISGDDNTIITLPSNSRVEILDARRYAINGKIDVQIRVLEGRSSIRAPKIDGEARFRAGTPLAVTAVRGTEFRVAYAEGQNLSLTEVVEGQVDVIKDDATQLTGAGFGVVAAPNGFSEPEELLGAPELVDGSKLQTEEAVAFAIEEIGEAAAYRTQIARDAGFIEIIDEAVTPTPDVVFDQLSDGRYFVRARGIAQSGLEGLAKPYSFRRKRVGSDAGQEASPLADTFKFAWRSQGDGQSYHAFQLWRADAPETLVVDEVGMENTAMLIGDIEPGKYVWRVATFQIDEGEVIKVWGPAQEIELSE